MRFKAIAAVCLGFSLALSACTTTSTRLASAGDIGAPAPNARVLLVRPDVQLNLLTASGLPEPRADWSRQARDDLSAELSTALQGKTHPIELFDPDTVEGGRPAQLLRLHDAVGRSILAFNYGLIKLPTKSGPFDWTLGEGAQVLGEERHAAYALFVTARGAYASSGRKAMMVGAALLGVSVPMGGQQVFASLVDLKTGRIVWFNVAMAGPTADMRNAEGARSLVASLLKGAPL